MRSKTPLALMEQLVMVLVFALAAALCLQVFVFSDQASRKNSELDCAVLLAQNTAEAVKANHGDLERAADLLGGEIRQTLWSSYYYEDLSPAPDRESARYHVDVLPGRGGVAGLGKASIDVFRYDGSDPLFSLTVAWQEVDGNG